jgi:phage-related protein
MRPGLFAVGENRSSNATQTGLTQNDDVIQALSSNRSDQSLEMGVLPRTIPSVYRIWYTPSVGKNPKLSTGTATQPEALERQGKRVPAIFFRTEAGGEPVRDWLKGLPLPQDRKRIGEDIKTVEFGWPIGMPVCMPLGDGIYEVRTSLVQNRISRVLFYIDKKGRMVLLHGFIKKTQKTPDEDLELARSNKNKHQRGLK